MKKFNNLIYEVHKLVRAPGETSSRDAKGNYRQQFICVAASELTRVFGVAHIVEFQTEIVRRLDGCGTYETWLTKQGIPNGGFSQYYRNYVQLCRHEWLGDLHKESLGLPRKGPLKGVYIPDRPVQRTWRFWK